MKCVNHFVQSAVNARRQGDQNYNSSVVAETLKLLANSWYVYQNMDPGRHSVKRYRIDRKTHAVVNKKNVEDVWTYQRSSLRGIACEIETEQREPIIVGFFLLQFAKLYVGALLQLFYKVLGY